MKKTRTKPLESPSLRSYMFIVKQILLNNLAIFIFTLATLGLGTPLHANPRTLFLLINTSDKPNISLELESKGVRIRKTIPPSIVVAEFPSNIKPEHFPFIKQHFQTAIPVNELKNLGPLGMAAGIEWNRSLPSNISVDSSGHQRAMSASVARQTIPAPESIEFENHGVLYRLKWQSAPGAQLTEIHVARDSDFQQMINRSKTDQNAIELPIPTSGVPLIAYVRLRHVDRPDATNKKNDVMGPWSKTVLGRIELTNQIEDQSAPVLTSPVNDYQTNGFSVILEWSAQNTDLSRVQISDSDDFLNPLSDLLVSKHEYVVPSSSLHIGDQLYWRVMIFDSSTSAWSAVRSFTVNAPSHPESDMFINPEAPQ